MPPALPFPQPFSDQHRSHGQIRAKAAILVPRSLDQCSVIQRITLHDAVRIVTVVAPKHLPHRQRNPRRSKAITNSDRPALRSAPSNALRASMPRQTALPPNLPPRLISRLAAAAYVCLSPTTFDQMVEEGRMPKPRLLSDRRVAWDVRALDQAIDLLPSENCASDDESWSDVDGA